MALPERSDKEDQLNKGGPEPLEALEKKARLTKESSENLVVKEFVMNIFEDEPPEQEQPKQAALTRVFVLPGIDRI